MMTLNQYSKFVGEQLREEQRPLHILAFMSMLEVAESGNEVKRIHTKDGGELTDSRRYKLLEEMGDEFYYFVARMTHLGFTLDEIMEFNVRKLTRREEMRAGSYSPVPDTYSI